MVTTCSSTINRGLSLNCSANRDLFEYRWSKARNREQNSFFFRVCQWKDNFSSPLPAPSSMQSSTMLITLIASTAFILDQSGASLRLEKGIEEGLTQMCKCSNDPRKLAVWNFPLDITFKSTNPHGWPQLIMSIYGLDFFGHDVIRGYGVCHLPLKTGRHEKRVPIYVPESSSMLQNFVEWLTGRRPELIDPTILASGGGRELTRMRVEGVVTVTFNVVLKDLFKLGYDNGEKWKK